MDIGLLLLRLTVGSVMAFHGTQKLFGWFGDPGLDGTLGAALVFSVMIVAAVTVSLEKGVSIQNGGYEYSLVLGVTALSIAFTGLGLVSLDAPLGHYLSRKLYGIGAILVGLIGAAMTLSQRQAVSVK